jgi:surface-anchored protein
MRTFVQPLTSMAIVCGLSALLAAPVQAADPVLTTGHTDVGIFYGAEEPGEPSEWDLHVHSEETDTEYAAEEVILGVKDEALTNRPVDPAFNFIGVGAGQSYYRLPQTENSDLLFLGLGAEEIEPGTFASYFESDPRINASGAYIRLQVVSVTNLAGGAAPGIFSVWQSDVDGPNVFVSSFDGLDSNDTLFALSGSHAHYNWGFSAAGDYVVTVRATGYTGPGQTGQITSGDASYRFAVGSIAITAASAPEPSSIALMIGAGGGLLGMMIRRRRR